MSLTDYTGAQKVAASIMQLPDDLGARLLRAMGPDRAADVATEIDRLPRLPREDVEAILAEVHELVCSDDMPVRGGKSAVDALLSGAFGENADDIRARMASAAAGKSFEFLEDMDPSTAAALLEAERPVTTALVMNHLSNAAKAGIMTNLPGEYRGQVGLAIAKQRTPDPSAVAQIADSLRARAGSAVATNKKQAVQGGVDSLVRTIIDSTAEVEKSILAYLDEHDPELAEDVRSKLFAFEDLATLTSRDLQSVMAKVNLATLARALRDAKEPLVALITAALSTKNQERLVEAQGGLGKVRSADRDNARAEIVKIVRDLDATDKISVGRDDD